MSEQDKKARLKFMEEFDKVLDEGNKTVTARAKALGAKIGMSYSNINRIVYMGGNMCADDVATVHGCLQADAVQERITDEGNEGFLDPAIWLPSEERAAWRKALREGAPLPKGGRRKKGGPRKKSADSKDEQPAAKSGGGRAKKTGTDLVNSPASSSNGKQAMPPTRSFASRPEEQEVLPANGLADAAEVTLFSPDGSQMNIRIPLRQGVRIRTTPAEDGGWEVCF